jgi:WD40 repeat protein
MALTRDSHYLYFGTGYGGVPNQINKFSVNKKEVVAKFEGPFFSKGIESMTLSPDSNSLYIATGDELLQFSLKDPKVIQKRNIKERPNMNDALIYSMTVTKNNQFLVTATIYMGTPEKGTKEDLSGEKWAQFCGPVCLWSTKDLTLVKT